MLQFLVISIKIFAVYFNFFFITAKQYCLPISSSIGLTAVPPKNGNNTNTKTKMEFVLFFYNDYFGIKVETNVQKEQKKSGV